MHLRHRGLFIAYAPAEAPTIAISVAIEGGGYGASSAAPVARKVLDAWLLGKMPEPPPSAGVARAPPEATIAVAVRPDFAGVRGSSDAQTVAPNVAPPAP